MNITVTSSSLSGRFELAKGRPGFIVLPEYSPGASAGGEGYQSEAALEREFIAALVQQGYERLAIHREAELVANLRSQLEKLNGFRFSEREWQDFFRNELANPNAGIAEKTALIQQERVLCLAREDGTTKNVVLFDAVNPVRNSLQVISQFEQEQGDHPCRYDVTILVNGFPLVHIELKRRGVALREAFNQIGRYQRGSFQAASGLYEYVQIFVISNGTHTRYYSNTARRASPAGARPNRSGSTFEFTSAWADVANRHISGLMDFAATFLTPVTLLTILARYCVFTAEKQLLVMRPYQIAATERILERIAQTGPLAGTPAAGGYIWHTTGSGKTLTSFKTAQLATQLPFIAKVLFVVDRRDLDYQTMREYDRFEPGSANGNNSVKVLTRQLADPACRIIVTTIQKLAIFISRNPAHPVFAQRCVLILDECHRSQFGELHTAIRKAFKNSHLFGFTGTPIFAANSAAGARPGLATTEQAFGSRLHAYTIVNAIADGNVLPFRIDFVNTAKMAPNIIDCKVEAIDSERALAAPGRIAAVVRHILAHFAQKTKRSSFYALQGQNLAGFNSILATASIPMAMAYYRELKRQLAAAGQKLVIAVIFSFSPNDAPPGEAADFAGPDTAGADLAARDFLEQAIADYNARFGTSFDTSADKFQNYYKDLSLRMKRREIDLLVVVNMFLTGFDAATLNTLWVDKNLSYHGLIQAFSRTNRILNSVKTFGNIVCYRNLEQGTEAALALFGDKDAQGQILLRPYADYYGGYEDDKGRKPGYQELVAELRGVFPLAAEIAGEQAEDCFIALFGKILRLRNILASFDEFAGNELLGERELQDYQSRYLDLYQQRRRAAASREDITGDIVFELELARQLEVNMDYILMLVEKYRATHCRDRTILASVRSAVSSSLELRSKLELIEDFIARINADTEVRPAWQDFVAVSREEELGRLITEERLKPAETREFMAEAFASGGLRTTGEDIQRLMPPLNPFDRAASERKKGIMERLKAFFEKYLGAAA